MSVCLWLVGLLGVCMSEREQESERERERGVAQTGVSQTGKAAPYFSSEGQT